MGYWVLIQKGFTLAFEFCLKYWKQLIVLTIVAFLGWKWYSYTSQIDALTKKTQQLEAQKATYQQLNGQMAQLTTLTEQSIQSLKGIHSQLTTDMSKLAALQKKQNDAFTQQLKRIKDRPAPTNDAESVDYLISTSDELRSGEK